MVAPQPETHLFIVLSLTLLVFRQFQSAEFQFPSSLFAWPRLSQEISSSIRIQVPCGYDPYLPLLATTGTVHLRLHFLDNRLAFQAAFNILSIVSEKLIALTFGISKYRFVFF